jgi:hypothetical protein
MRTQRSIRWSIALVALVAAMVAVLAVPVGRADSPEFKVIVHPDNPVSAVDSSLVRAGYLRRADWPDGVAIRAVDLSPRHPVRTTFVKRVLGKTPEQLRRYWNQQIFSGKGTPPPQVDALDEVITFVLEHRGGVAYVPADAAVGAAKVVALR